MPTLLRQYRREWCPDECGRRVFLNPRAQRRGGVCDTCYRAAMERAEYDEEQLSLRRYTDEERARI